MIEVKPTLAGLAEALNKLLANGADPEAEVMLGVFEEQGQVGTRIFDGVVETETIEQAESLGARTKLRVVLSEDVDYEVRAHQENRSSYHCGGFACVPIDDGACYCQCASCNGAAMTAMGRTRDPR